MISWEKSKSGSPVVRYNQFQLSSFGDPVIEADRWVGQQIRGIAPQWHVFVLGLGGGYHIMSLLRHISHQRLTVLSLTDGLVESVARNQGKDFSGVEVFEVGQWTDLIQNGNFLTRLNQPYVVLRFRPAEVHDRSGYQELSDFLVGRDPHLFTTLAKTQKNWGHHLRCFALPSEEGSRLLSIKDLAAVSRRGRAASSESQDEGVLTLLALREMVR